LGFYFIVLLDAACPDWFWCFDEVLLALILMMFLLFVSAMHL